MMWVVGGVREFLQVRYMTYQLLDHVQRPLRKVRPVVDFQLQMWQVWEIRPRDEALVDDALGGILVVIVLYADNHALA